MQSVRISSSSDVTQFLHEFHTGLPSCLYATDVLDLLSRALRKSNLAAGVQTYLWDSTTEGFVFHREEWGPGKPLPEAQPTNHRSRVHSWLSAGVPVFEPIDSYLPGEDIGARRMEGGSVSVLPLQEKDCSLGGILIWSALAPEQAQSLWNELESAFLEAGFIMHLLEQRKAGLKRNEIFHKILDTAQNYVLIFNLSGELLYTNAFLQSQLEHTPSDLQAMTVSDLFPQLKGVGFQAFLMENDGDASHRQRLTFQTSRGDCIPADFIIRKIHWQNQSVFLCTGNDVGHCEYITSEAVKQRQMAEALMDISALLNRKSNLNDVLDQILEVIVDVVPQTAANIMLIQGNMARIVRCRGYNEMGVEEILKKKNYPIPQLFNLRTMAETHQPIWIPNVKLDPRWLDYPESNWIQSFVGAPIVTQSGVVGFINLDSNTPDFYKPEDGERLLAFANQAAVAVENAKLFEELRSHNEQLDLLNSITASLLLASNLPAALEQMADQLAQLYQADDGLVILAPSPADAEIVAGSHSVRKYARSLAAALEEEAWYADIKQSRQVVRLDLAVEKTQPSDKIVTLLPVRRVILFPLAIGNQALGQVLINFRNSDARDGFDEHLTEQVGLQLSLAISKLQSLREAQLHAQELSRVNSMVTALSHVAVTSEKEVKPKDVMSVLGDELEKIGIHSVIAFSEPNSMDFIVQYLSIRSPILRRLEKFSGVKLIGSRLRQKDFPVLYESLISRDSVFIRDAIPIAIKAFPEVLSPFRDSLLHEMQVSGLTRGFQLPLVLEDNNVGILGLWGDTLIENDMDAATIFASQVAVAIQKSRLYDEVQRLAITDDLTGFLNRRGLLQSAKREVERAVRFHHPLSAMMFDVDDFKRVNDEHGHLTGDRVLKAIAGRINTCLREMDIAGRYGGEEFMVVLLECDEENACQIAERIRRCVVDEPVVITGIRIPVSISIGVAGLEKGIKSLSRLIKSADQALYIAKNAGKNCVATLKGPLHHD